MAFTFKKPSDLWGDDPEMKKAESSKQAYIPFVYPVAPILEIVLDPATNKPIMEANNRPKTHTVNLFDRFIDYLIHCKDGKDALQKVHCLDLDVIWNNSTLEKIVKWRTKIPNGKTLTYQQLYPTPFSGRKLYYTMMLLEDGKTFEWDEATKKAKVIPLVDDRGEKIQKLGCFIPNKPPTVGGNFECYINTFEIEEIKKRVNETDEQGNMVERIVTEKGKEMKYWKAKAYLKNKDLTEFFLQIEKSVIEQVGIDPTFKPYLWFFSNNLKKNAEGSYYEYSLTVDGIKLHFD